VATNRKAVSSAQPASDSIDAIFSDYTNMGSRMAKRESVLVRREIKIMNELGLHARPAAEFIRAANAYRSEIWLLKGEERFSATSIIEVLMANLDCGDTATIEAKGPDAEEAVARLVKLVRELREKDLQGGWSLWAEDDY
jgi:phosphocarrier protein HPr